MTVADLSQCLAEETQYYLVQPIIMTTYSYGRINHIND